jgi:hypothetical protein
LDVPSPESFVVDCVEFPQYDVCCHEAGHLLFALALGREYYVSAGIIFWPPTREVAENGVWIKQLPVMQVRLSLIGLLTQIELAPDSIVSAPLRRALRKSIIFGTNGRLPAGVSKKERDELAGAWKDMENARAAGRRAGMTSPREVVKFLRREEAELKLLLQRGDFAEMVDIVARDVLLWLTSDGRTEWEFAFGRSSGAMYPAARALALLGKRQLPRVDAMLVHL